jgi:large subunit ribosomal protein L31
MKKDIHPKYGAVVFKDISSGLTILTKSSASTDETIEWEDGKTYPLIRVEISSKSTLSILGNKE